MNALSRMRSARIRASTASGLRRALGAAEDRDRGVERARRDRDAALVLAAELARGERDARDAPRWRLVIAVIERVELAGLEIVVGLALHRAARGSGGSAALAARRSDPSSRSARRRARRSGCELGGGLRVRVRVDVAALTGERARHRVEPDDARLAAAALGDQLLRDLLALDELAERGRAPVASAIERAAGSFDAERERLAAGLDGDRVVVRRGTRRTRASAQSSAVRNRRDA